MAEGRPLLAQISGMPRMSRAFGGPLETRTLDPLITNSQSEHPCLARVSSWSHIIFYMCPTDLETDGTLATNLFMFNHESGQGLGKGQLLLLSSAGLIALTYRPENCELQPTPSRKPLG
jgi:hypothetical protein